MSQIPMARGGDGGGVRRFRDSDRSLHGGGGGPVALGRRDGCRGQGDGKLRRDPSSCSWGRTPSVPTGQSMLPTMDAYVRGEWAHKDERYRSLPVFMHRGVSCEFDFTTPEAMARSPFYQELLRPQALEWFAVVKVGGNTDVWGLSLQCSPAQGPFSPHELDSLAGLSRRLAGAAELACAFGFARMEAALDALEASHSPVAMIDRMGEVLRLNRSAERLLGPDLQITRRRIISWSRDATQALDRALHDLIWRRSAEAFQPPVLLPRRHSADPSPDSTTLMHDETRLWDISGTDPP